MKNTADWKAFYDEKFETEYGYDGTLGALVNGDVTEFLLWSPVAEAVFLRLYADKDSAQPKEIRVMEPCEKGVWTYTAEENLHGVYYDYELMIEGKKTWSNDPYAYGCGVNGKRGMIVDHKKASPEGWEEDVAPKRQNEDIIYETHVKEFSWDAHGGFPEEHRGKYLAFTDRDTSLNGEGEFPTGIAYLQKLGVTHIQLMPIFDFASVDESGDAEQFNWGYDPQNFFVPEGSYASDPYNGTVRIVELKRAIQSLHRAGLRVVMDVVLNHTWSFDNSLQHTVPWYFYRQYEDGRPSDGSGCGNDLASERKMCQKFIQDCVLYWAREYHIDGFRFDLMGLLDIGLINGIRKKLDDIYGKGEKLLFGEPWAAAQTAIDYKFLLATKFNFDQLDENVGYYSDDIRDMVKGQTWHPKESGFVNGGRGYEKQVVTAFRAFDRPASQIISYLSCHDNQTLWDKLTETTRYEELRRDEYRLAAALYMSFPGRLLMLSGEEFLRTKDGYSNTYNAPIYLNRLDWEATKAEAEMVEYYKGLIALRKQLPCLYDKGQRTDFPQTPVAENGLVAILLDNQTVHGGSQWDRVFLIFNGKEHPSEVALPKGVWKTLVDKKSSFRWLEHGRKQSDSVTIEPVSALILGRTEQG